MLQFFIKVCVFSYVFFTVSVSSERVFPQGPNKINPSILGFQSKKLMALDDKSLPVNISKKISLKPTVLVFYRGGWCPYCNWHLGELQKIAHQVDKLGFQIIAISPDQPTIMKQHRDKTDLRIHTFSDSNLDCAKQFGIVFKVNDQLFNKYKNQYGIDLEANTGLSHHLLPVPSVFLMDTNGIVKFSYVNVDYKVRLDSKLLLEAIRSLKL